MMSMIRDRLLEVWGGMLGAVGLGYIPDIKAQILNSSMTSTDQAFQHTVWSITIVVGIFAIVAGIQKQVDRFKNRRKKND